MSWIYTYTGKKMDLLNPSVDSVDLRDIAHALSNLCRFTGHVYDFYSVARHSMLVANLVPKKHKLVALLHDAPEAYLGDVSTPLKNLPDMSGYKRLEENMWKVIAKKFIIDPVIPECVREADHNITMSELNMFLRASCSINDSFESNADIENSFVREVNDLMGL